MTLQSVYDRQAALVLAMDGADSLPIPVMETGFMQFMFTMCENAGFHLRFLMDYFQGIELQRILYRLL